METSAVQSAKFVVAAVFGLSKDALHVYFGLTIFLIASYFVRKRFRVAVPLLTVLAAACLGEILDARDNLAELGRWRWRGSLHDILNTMFWPLVISGLIQLGVFPPAKGPQRHE